MADPGPYEYVKQLDANGNVVSGGAAGGTSTDDGEVFTPGTDAFTPVGGAYEATPSTLIDNTKGFLGLTAKRAVRVAIESTAGVAVDLAALLANVASNIAAAATSLAALDNAVAGNELQVDVLTMPAITGTVDLGATDNAVLDAIAASVAAIDTDTSAILTTAAHDAAFGTAGAADAQVRSVQGIAGGTTLPVTEASAAAIAASLSVVDDWDESDRAKVNPIVGQAGVAGGTGTDGATVQRMTLATNVGLPAGTNNIGDVDVLTVPRSMMGPAQPGTAIDSYTHAAFNLSAGNDQVLVSSAASKQIWVYGIGFTVNVAGTVSFQDEDNVAITGVMQMGATGGMVVSPSGNFSMPIWKLGTDKDLEVDVVTSELDGWIDYAIVSV